MQEKYDKKASLLCFVLSLELRMIAYYLSLSYGGVLAKCASGGLRYAHPKKVDKRLGRQNLRCVHSYINYWHPTLKMLG